ncbi:MAG: MFS transporter [Candidatus Andersenbacteria bacterium]
MVRSSPSLWQRICAVFVLNSRPELKELFSFSLLFSFAFALIIIFEPVFFYQQGFSLAHIAGYYALHYLTYVLALPFGGKFAARFGLERSLAVSTPIYVLYFLMLAAMPTWPVLFWLSPWLLTLHKIFYWPAYHAHFAKFTDHKNRGTEQSWMRLIIYGTGIFGPLIGGSIAFTFGFPTLFVVAACTVLLAGIPLLKTQERFRIVSFPYTAAWKIIVHSRHRRMVLAMCGWADDLVYLVFWPLWLYLILGTTEALGLVASAAMVVMTLLGFLVGELIDRHSARKVLRWATPFVVVANIIKPWAVTPLRVLFANIFVQTANTYMVLPFTTQLYINAKRSGALAYALAFETVLAIAKATMAIGLVILFLNVAPETGLHIAFWIAAAISLLYGVL